ncbi:helix-turn-helix domain-containing protein [Gemmiger sp.]|uniref:helix-turn-helix domain-containing protein n=1 Tax=Gemmiger sp. TaxID=2049027 RepID=UPI003AB74E03
MDNAKTVETIRALCKKKKTSLTRIEEKLGFSNGYIGKMAKRPSSPPYDKLVAIANELGVTVADLTGDTENEKKPTAQGDGLKLDSYEDIDQWLDTLDGKGLDMVIAMAAAKKVKVNEDKS